MFERFSDAARQSVVLAYEEARTLGDNEVGPEHILLGLIREDQGVAATALHAQGISLKPARQQVKVITGRGQPEPAEHIGLTQRSKQVFQLSLHEAEQLGYGYVGTAHILLCLIRQGEAGAAQMLAALGADPDGVRQDVIKLLHSPSSEEPTSAGERSQVHVSVSSPEGHAVILEESSVIPALEAEVARLRALLRQHGIEPDDPAEPA